MIRNIMMWKYKGREFKGWDEFCKSYVLEINLVYLRKSKVSVVGIEKVVKNEIREGRECNFKIVLFSMKWSLNCILSVIGRYWKVLVSKFGIWFVF